MVNRAGPEKKGKEKRNCPHSKNPPPRDGSGGFYGPPREKRHLSDWMKAKGEVDGT